MPTKHVIFDFDGVLCDSFGVCAEEYERLRTAKYPTLPKVTDATRMDDVYSGPLKDSLDRWLGAGGSSEFFDLHSAAMAGRVEELAPFPGVPQLLRGLPDISTSVVSSSHDAVIRRVLSSQDGLPRSVFSIKGRDSRQPKTKKIESVLAKAAVRVDDAIYVGDLESDLLYCKDVSLRCVLATFGYHSRHRLMRHSDAAYGLVDTVEELAWFIAEELSGRP